MKRWTIVMLGGILSMMLLTNTYATELESYDLPNDGRIVISFSNNELEKDSPVKGAIVNIYYIDENDNMIDIRDMEELKGTTINLVSDANGIVIINNLPYGLYQYEVVSLPEGFKECNETGYIAIDLMNKNAQVDIACTNQIQMAEGGETKDEEDIEEKQDEIEKEPEQIIPDKPDETIKDNTITEDKSNENQNSYDTIVTSPGVSNKKEENIIKVSEKIYTQDNEEVVQNKKDEVNKITKIVKPNLRKSNVDMIKKFKEYKISDCIKVAINTIDKTMYEYSFITDLPDNGDKNNKLKKINYTAYKVIDLHLANLHRYKMISRIRIG